MLPSSLSHYTICPPAAVNGEVLTCRDTPGMAASAVGAGITQHHSLSHPERPGAPASPGRAGTECYSDLEHLPAQAGLIQDAAIPPAWVIPPSTQEAKLI